MRVKCLAKEHNTMSPARPRTRTTRSGVERTNHEATAPPTASLFIYFIYLKIHPKVGVKYNTTLSPLKGILTMTFSSIH